MDFKKLIAVVALAVGGLALVFAGVGGPATAAKDDERYRMSPVDNGFVRLDTQTGAMAFCKRNGENWSCRPMADTGATSGGDVARLRAENAELKGIIREMEERFGSGPRGPSGERGSGSGSGPERGTELRDDDVERGDDGDRRPNIQLPDEEQVDQAVDYLERMIRKFRERFEKFGEKIQPRDDPSGKDDNQDDGPTQL